MIQPAIAVDGLGHTYQSGGTTMQILQQVSINVDPGQSVALIGRSGSGKSTLLNLISGLEPVAQGDVRLNGQSLKTMNDRHRTLLRGREVGFIYQAFNLIPTLNVQDNVTLPLALAGVEKSEREARSQQMLEAVSLIGRGEGFPDRLSGGEQQRVAIARALIHQPTVILADEPTGNLDATSGRQVLKLLFDLVKDQGAALLLVTHSVEVASNADRVLTLEHARINESGASKLNTSVAW